MKILFLDIDGVLNNADWFFRSNKTKAETAFERNTADIDPGNVVHLETIMVAVPDLEIVISSTWRMLHTLPEIRSFLKATGGEQSHQRIIDKTPHHSDAFRGRDYETFRGREINAWILAHDPLLAEYVILDDDGDMLDHQKDGHFIQTDWDVGLQPEHATRAISILNPLLLQKNEVE